MNKKGFTLIELVISIVLITVIIVPTFSIVLNLKNKQIIAGDKQELTKIKNLLTKSIEDDVLTKGVKKISLYTKIHIDNQFEVTTFDETKRNVYQDYIEQGKTNFNSGDYFISYIPIRATQNYFAIYTGDYALEHNLDEWIINKKDTIDGSKINNLSIDSKESYKEYIIRIDFKDNDTKYLIVNTKDKIIIYDNETYKIDVPNAEIIPNSDMLTYNHQGYIDDNDKPDDELGKCYQRIRIPISYNDDTLSKNSLGLDYGINIVIAKS